MLALKCTIRRYLLLNKKNNINFFIIIKIFYIVHDNKEFKLYHVT